MNAATADDDLLGAQAEQQASYQKSNTFVSRLKQPSLGQIEDGKEEVKEEKSAMIAAMQADNDASEGDESSLEEDDSGDDDDDDEPETPKVKGNKPAKQSEALSNPLEDSDEEYKNGAESEMKGVKISKDPL